MLLSCYIPGSWDAHLEFVPPHPDSTSNSVRKHLGKRTWLSQSQHLHAPLVHQGNKRLIQRLRFGRWVRITLARGAGLSVCKHGRTALWQTQTNTATQSRPWHQTPRSEPRSFTATLQPECIFPQEYREKTGEAILKGLRRELLPQFVILDRKPKKQTGWELTLKWGEAT